MSHLHRNIGKYSESVLLQLKGLLKLLNQDQYIAKYHIKNPRTKEIVHTDSAIGSHVRHIHDHFEKVLSVDVIEPRPVSDNNSIGLLSQTATVLEYDVRTRGTKVEYDLSAAILANDDLVQRLRKITMNEHIMSMPVSIAHVTNGYDNKQNGAIIVLPSNIARELVFVSHHGIHHVATVKSLIETHYSSSIEVNAIGSDVGKAPSTIRLDHQEKKNLHEME